MGCRFAAALVAVAVCASLNFAGRPALDVHATGFAVGTIITDAGSVGSGAAINQGQLPFSLAVNGPHLYVGDVANPVVRDVNTTTGQETARAGNDGYGFTGDGGPATAAMIQGAGAIAQCGTDTYFSDVLNYVIRKIDVAGNITTVIGNGTYGFSGDGGPATAAQIGQVYGLTCIPGSTGPDFPFLYFSDGGHGVVRGLTPNGNVVTYVSGLGYPAGIVFDGAANLYIADPGNEIVVRLDAIFGTFRVLAGTTGAKGYSGDGGAGSLAKLDNPWGLAVTSSSVSYGCGCLVMIADNNNNRVRVVDEHGVINTFAGNGIAGFAGDGGIVNNASTELNHPYGLGSDAVNHALYVADYLNFRVRKIDLSTNIITTAAGNGTPSWSGDGGQANVAQLGNPVGVAFDPAGNEYISDNQDNVIREIAVGGVINTVAGTPGKSGFAGDAGLATAALLSDPTGIAVNANGDIFIADTLNQRVRRVDHVTHFIDTIAGNGASGFFGDNGPATAADLNAPLAVAVDAVGNVFISDTANNRVRMVSPGGTITTYAGNGTAAYSGDNGPAGAASLSGPLGLALDSVGNLYISDSLNDRVRRVDHTTFVITLVAGNGTAGLAGDNNLATGAELKYPYGLAVDTSGRIYIADRANQRVRMVDSSGIITSIVATCGVNTGFSGDGGQAAFAQVNSPLGLAATGGQLFIADVNNNRVRHVYGLPGLRVPSCPSAAAPAQNGRSIPVQTGSVSPGGVRIPWIDRPAAGSTGLSTLRGASVAPPAAAPVAPPRAAAQPAASRPAAAPPAAAVAARPAARRVAAEVQGGAPVQASHTPPATLEERPSYLPVGLILVVIVAAALLLVRKRNKRIS